MSSHSSGVQIPEIFTREVGDLSVTVDRWISGPQRNPRIDCNPHSSRSSRSALSQTLGKHVPAKSSIPPLSLVDRHCLPYYRPACGRLLSLMTLMSKHRRWPIDSRQIFIERDFLRMMSKMLISVRSSPSWILFLPWAWHARLLFD